MDSPSLLPESPRCLLQAGVILWTLGGASMDVFSSTAELAAMFDFEKQLLSHTDKYLATAKKRLDIFEKISSDFEHIWNDSWNATSRCDPGAESEPEQPALRACVSPGAQWRRIADSVRWNPFQDLVSEVGARWLSYIPSTESLAGSLESLVRLLDMYQLDVRDLTWRGEIRGHRAHAPLRSPDLRNLAIVAINMGKFELAARLVDVAMETRPEDAWVEEMSKLRRLLEYGRAELTRPEPDVFVDDLGRPLSDEHDQDQEVADVEMRDLELRFSWSLDSDLSEDWEPTAELPGDREPTAKLPGDKEPPVELPGDREPTAELPGDREPTAEHPGDRETTAELPRDRGPPVELPGDREQDPALSWQETIQTYDPDEGFQIPDETSEQTQLYEALCRGEHVRDDDTLTCHYRTGTGSLLSYNRWKTEVLQRSPPVFMIYDVITDREADALIQTAAPMMSRARVIRSTGPGLSGVRLGKTAWVGDPEVEGCARGLTARMSRLTGLNCQDFAEYLQMAVYGLGGMYEPHTDYNRVTFKYGLTEGRRLGDRLATFMIYLTDVKAGGATVFPKWRTAAFPVKNAALFWYNLYEDGVSNPTSLHAGCPVLLGHKWVANKWIHEYGQEFRRPCALDPDSPPEHQLPPGEEQYYESVMSRGEGHGTDPGLD